MTGKVQLTQEQIEAIEHCVSMVKEWNSTRRMKDLWFTEKRRGFPRPYQFRTTVKIESEILEGAFVECYYKKSKVPGERDKVSMALCVNEKRAVAVDIGPRNATHTNTIGKGRPHYQQTIGMPHIHFLVDGDDGYAEPLEDQEENALWAVFIRESNVIKAPDFEPPTDQLEMAV